ncbi:hypothetical protein B4589_009795 [Halolamina sp. CBA1230]|uniref:hypothetical protein n=1 Tax=Halolamina sp. CBA1230 TaxID=1853690 RepID=UPI001179E67D|nr:hypothetical protein [Halolamina sp. CBA1230]QKY20657.1 hypothetical protein B4589_009795 [Halolamina sp. CBA1230]
MNLELCIEYARHRRENQKLHKERVEMISAVRTLDIEDSEYVMDAVYDDTFDKLDQRRTENIENIENTREQMSMGELILGKMMLHSGVWVWF